VRDWRAGHKHWCKALAALAGDDAGGESAGGGTGAAAANEGAP
jgi:hypothetical protein